MRGDVSGNKGGDERNESEGKENGLSRCSTDGIGDGVSSSVRTDFELDELVNMGFTFLRGMLSEKEHVGFSVGYKLSRRPGTAGGIAMDNEVPTDDDWENRQHYQPFLTPTSF